MPGQEVDVILYFQGVARIFYDPVGYASVLEPPKVKDLQATQALMDANQSMFGSDGYFNGKFIDSIEDLKRMVTYCDPAAIQAHRPTVAGDRPELDDVVAMARYINQVVADVCANERELQGVTARWEQFDKLGKIMDKLDCGTIKELKETRATIHQISANATKYYWGITDRSEAGIEAEFTSLKKREVDAGRPRPAVKDLIKKLQDASYKLGYDPFKNVLEGLVSLPDVEADTKQAEKRIEEDRKKKTPRAV